MEESDDGVMQVLSHAAVAATVAYAYINGLKTEAVAVGAAYILAEKMNQLTDRSTLCSVAAVVPGIVGATACLSIRKIIVPENEWQFTMKNCALYGASYILLNNTQAFTAGSIAQFVVRTVTEERVTDLMDAVRGGVNKHERRMRERVRDLRVAEFDQKFPLYCASRPPPATVTAMNTECSVCLVKIDPTRGHRILECKHAYHQECIDEWAVHRRTCPLCNTPMYSDADEDPFTDDDGGE